MEAFGPFAAVVVTGIGIAAVAAIALFVVTILGGRKNDEQEEA